MSTTINLIILNDFNYSMTKLCITSPLVGEITYPWDNIITYDLDVILDASPNNLQKSFCNFILELYKSKSKFTDEVDPIIYFSSIGKEFVAEWDLFTKYHNEKKFKNFIVITSDSKYIVQLNILLDDIHHIVSELSWMNYYYQTQKFCSTIEDVFEQICETLPHKDIARVLDGFRPSYMQVPFPIIAKSMYDRVFKYLDTRIIYFPSNMTKDLWHKNF